MEKKTKKRDLLNPHCPISECHVAELVRRFPKFLAEQFGYQIDYMDLDGPNPVNLPFPMGETTKAVSYTHLTLPTKA